jgi:hypothetical protein
MRTRLLIPALLGLLVTLLGAGAAAALPPGPPTRSTSSQVALDGPAFASGAGEYVDITGDLHVVTSISGSETDGWTLEWHANVDHARGTGQTSGGRYVLNGATSGTETYPPGPPVRTASFEPTFSLIPPGPPVHPSSPCSVLVDLSFDEAGHVTGVQAHFVDSVQTVD